MLNRLSRYLICIGILLLTACASQPAASEPQATSQPKVTTVATILPHNPPATCPITRPASMSFTPPSPFLATLSADYADQFWYGTADLWTMLRNDGNWSGLPHNEAGYTNKVWWWSEGYNIGTAQPNLTVTGKRLDAPSETLTANDATNAAADFGATMLIGVDFPSLGCWELTGHYQGHDLSFVVWVGP